MNNVLHAYFSITWFAQYIPCSRLVFKWFELMSLIKCMDAIKADFICGLFCIDVKYYSKIKSYRSHFISLYLFVCFSVACGRLHLPFGDFGTKSRVLSLHRTYWSVPSIQIYVARILFSGKSNVRYRSKTFLLINALGDDSSVLDI